MEELENEELNRELCALAVDDMFESWSPEIQEQVLAEWNDWEEPTKPGHCCNQCGKRFTRSTTLRRHIQTLHSDEKQFTCDNCQKSFATRNKLKRHEKVQAHQRNVHQVGGGKRKRTDTTTTTRTKRARVSEGKNRI